MKPSDHFPSYGFKEALGLQNAHFDTDPKVDSEKPSLNPEILPGEMKVLILDLGFHLQDSSVIGLYDSSLSIFKFKDEEGFNLVLNATEKNGVIHYSLSCSSPDYSILKADSGMTHEAALDSVMRLVFKVRENNKPKASH